MWLNWNEVLPWAIEVQSKFAKGMININCSKMQKFFLPTSLNWNELCGQLWNYKAAQKNQANKKKKGKKKEKQSPMELRRNSNNKK